MKLKCVPADFQVEELANLPLAESGDFAVYRVQKQNLTTDQLLQQLSHWLHKPLRFFAYAGMKDRHAITSQIITIKGDGPEMITTPSFSAQRCGYSAESIKPKHLHGNRFRIVLRDLSETELQAIAKNQSEILQNGVTNYFDDQRFRSQVNAANAFGFYLCRREYETALRTYICEVLPLTRRLNQMIVKQILATWGKWRQLAELRLPLPLRRVIRHLCGQPHDFQGAVFQLDVTDLRMMVAAVQSFLWNEMVARYFRQLIPAGLVAVTGAWQKYYFYRSLPADSREQLLDLTIALPHAGWNSPNPDLQKILQNLLTEFKLQLADFALPGLRKMFAAENWRRVIILPADFALSEPAVDLLYPDRFCQTLSLQLPPGSYATMIVKRLLI